jgi:UDP-3-O-[3-hydroxymyristoyl] glucosamine N-acyltransferase
MADARFYDKAGPFTLKDLARIAGAEIGGAADASVQFADVMALSMAGPSDVSFIDNRRYISDFTSSRAGAILVAPDLLDRAPHTAALLVTNSPYRGYALIAQAFYPARRPSGGIARTACVAPTSNVGDDVSIGAGAVIGENCEIGARSSIGPNTVIGDGVRIGEDCAISSNCTLTHCDVGSRVILHPGVRIGQDGFGFAPGMPSHTKVPQLGRVIIGDDVEIGANAAIDRGAAPDTVIGAGTKIDNLVHIAHNVTIGRGCFITGQVGISGSTNVGNYVMMGGQAGLIGHLTIGDGARISAQAGVTRDIPPGMTVTGTPAQESREHWRNLAFLSRLRKSKEGR